MLETSKDLLYLTLSGSIALLTVFLCAALYYVIRMLREANALVLEARAKVDELFALLEGLKEKLTSSVSYLGVLTDVAGQFLKYFSGPKKKRKGRGEEDDE